MAPYATNSTARFTSFSTSVLIPAFLLITALLTSIGLLGFYQIRAEDLRSEATTQQQNRGDEIATGIETYLISAQQLANTTAELAAPIRENPAEIESLLHRIFASAPNETIYGIGIWFEPYTFAEDEQFFGPYIHQGASPDTPVLTYEWTSEEYNFPTQGWYIAGKDGKGVPVFTEPYFDTDLVYVSASRAFYDATGTFTGVVTVDIVLPLLHDFLAAVNVREEESVYVTTAQGAILVHPQERELLEFARDAGETPGTILDLTLADLEAYHAANQIERDEVTSSVDYAGWTVHIASDEGFLFRDVRELRNTILTLNAILWLGVLIAVPTFYRFLSQWAGAQSEKAHLQAELTERKASQATLQEVNEELERRVRVRTAELEAAKEEAEEANRVKSRFLANMSHELRTPLNAILNFTEFMADGFFGPVTEEQIGILEKVSSSGDHLLSLINDILDITKIEVGKMELFIEEVEMSAVLRSVAATGKVLLRDNDVKLLTDIEEELPAIKGDRRRLHQVFLNLLSNAIKFTSQGSIILSGKREGDYLHMMVKDTGIGIAQEEQALIFERFQQARLSVKQSAGTGLGLPISRYFVDAHGGRLWMESELGKGSTFHVILPLVTRISGQPITESRTA